MVQTHFQDFKLPKTKQLADGVRSGNVRSLAKAITLIESRNPDHAKDAAELLDNLLPDTGNTIRIGISGIPGVGKSTFIETPTIMLFALEISWVAQLHRSCPTSNTFQTASVSTGT